MAVIHQTTITPSKLEMLTAWLPSRPWYLGDGEPRLTKAGGFRLDDPEGEVGIEFMVVTDAAPGADGASAPGGYLVPLTYRGAPLDGAGHALVSTAEHGVLGTRWVYDGCHDPVLTAQLLALIEGRVQAQAQSVSDAVDQEVARSFTGDGPVPADFTTVVDHPDRTELSTPDGATLVLRRILSPGSDGPADLPEGAAGHVAGAWELPDGSRARGLVAVLHV
ncbi:1,4-alpha-glucan branching protein [Streptomyces sp. NPDC045431]|uniref:maltokinase N-terminal cap-like domain-containing protein n=1 Tax=Streptomyces sp. NPDC045431 TaxID=3155613 RepID=UPI0033CB0B05